MKCSKSFHAILKQRLNFQFKLLQIEAGITPVAINIFSSELLFKTICGSCFGFIDSSNVHFAYLYFAYLQNFRTLEPCLERMSCFENKITKINSICVIYIAILVYNLKIADILFWNEVFGESFIAHKQFFQLFSH